MSELTEGVVLLVLGALLSINAGLLSRIWSAINSLQKTDKELKEEIQGTHKELKEEIQAVELSVAGDYVKRSELVDQHKEVMSKLEQLGGRMNKAAQLLASMKPQPGGPPP